jgi:hypothetical protein
MVWYGTTQNSLWPIDWTLNHYRGGVLFLRTNVRVWILIALNIWHIFPVENVPCCTGWTLTHYACFCIAIAAAFPRFWGLVERDLSPRDSPKGLCNISRDQKCWYCGRTSGQRYLTYSGPKWILSCTVLLSKLGISLEYNNIFGYCTNAMRGCTNGRGWCHPRRQGAS